MGKNEIKLLSELSQLSPEQLKNSFGVYIKQHRIAKNYTQQDLADLLGITQKSVNCFENGKTFPKQEHIFKIALALDMSLDEFVFRYTRFDQTICIREINDMLSTLSNEEQGLLLNMLKAICTSMKSNKKRKYNSQKQAIKHFGIQSYKGGAL